MPELEALLDVASVDAYYGDSHVLQGCSLSIGRECVAVLGRNGMGKTTLLRAIMGLTPPRAGSIRFRGEEVTGLRPFQVAEKGIGYVPQGRRLFPSLSVDEHLRLTYRRTRRGSGWSPERVYQLFPELAERRRVGGSRLSGGEQQMLAIGRALVTNPELVLLDEPSEGLSPMAVDRVIATCRQLLEDGLAVLLVEQNIHVAAALAARIHVLVSGRTVHSSPAREFLESDELRRRYLGV
jgi:branched-chain amino acid transport system ATP-binding protein